MDSPNPRYRDWRELIKRRIYQVWEYPEAARGSALGGEVLLAFTLNRAGTLLSVWLIRSSGYPILDQEAVRAVKAAAPFDPFPPDLVEDPVNIAGSFSYYPSPSRFFRN